MSAWQRRELARFNADGDDLRFVADPWDKPRCTQCGRAIEYSGECEGCRKLNEEDD